MKFKTLLLLIACCGITLLHADEPRERRLFTSANNRFELRLVDEPEGVWELFDIDIEKGRYFIYDEVKKYWRDKLKKKPGELGGVPGEFASQTALISNDGVAVAIIDDWSEALEDGLPVIRIFHNGKLMKNFFLRELLNDPKNISVSVSHSLWFCPNIGLKIDMDCIRLVTFELNQVSINVRSGRVEIVSLAIVRPDSILAYGKISRLSTNRYRIEVTRLIRGRIPSGGKVDFTATYDERLGGYGTVLIHEGRSDPRLSEHCRDMILNAANSPAAAKKRQGVEIGRGARP